ncbi:MAG: type II secretion system F family protein [Acidimicrobiia bacterium]
MTAGVTGTTVAAVDVERFAGPLSLCTALVAVTATAVLWRHRPSRRRSERARSTGAWPALRPAAALAVPLGLALWVVAPAALVAAAVAIPIGLVARRRRRRARAARRRAEELDALVTLTAAAMGGGLSIRRSLAEAVGWLDGELAVAVLDALAAAERGHRFADELERHVGGGVPELRPLARIVAETERYGAPALAALATLQHDLRLERRHRLERDARRLPVRLLFPLVGAVLPAFVLLAVVPMLAGALGGLGAIRTQAAATGPRGADAPAAVSIAEGVGP